MKTIFAFMTAATVCMGAAASPDRYTVKGKLPDASMDGKTAYLVCLENNDTIGRAVANKHHIEFQGVAPDTARHCMIWVEKKWHAELILEEGTIAVDFEETGHPAGTPLNDELNRINRATKDFRKAQKAARDEFQKEGRQDEWTTENNTVWKPRFKQMADSLFLLHGNDAVGHAMLPLLYQLTVQEQYDIIKKFGKRLAEQRHAKELREAVEGKINTAVGCTYVDFKGTTAEGAAASLSDYVGKGNYVLVDMWASWCGPCKRQNPHIAKIDEKYGGRGLTVLGVFVWDKPENLKPTMEQEKVTWNQIIDTEGQAVKAYGVNAIPCIMLISPDGKILARDLYGDKIESEVSKYIK